MLKNDCFGSAVDRCIITTNKNCVGCAFYKTGEQFKDDFKNAKETLKNRGLLKNAIGAYPLLWEMCKKIK